MQNFKSIWLLNSHVFTHGQLYIAMASTSASENIKIASNHDAILHVKALGTENLGLFT